jgi:hypothetical protein
LTRIGIFLEFVSFWFAAPELLGETRLKAMEDAVESFLRRHKLDQTVTRGTYLAGSVAILLSIAGLMLGYLLPPRFRVASVDIMAELFGAAIILFAMAILSLAARRLLPVMADDQEIRRRYLAIGAGLFVLGTVLQLLATF